MGACDNKIMSIDVHSTLINHYRSKRVHKPNKTIQSIVKQSFVKKPNEEEVYNPFEDFLKNEQHLAVESQPLDFRQLPRALKVYFPGPPSPPPKLEEVPYTYEIVPNIPYKMPKQKRGTVGEWVLQESYFLETRHNSMIEHKSERVHHKDMTEKKKIFRSAVKKLVNQMRATNMSLAQIKKNNGFNKKPYAYYNSQEFFQLVKTGHAQAEKLLEANPQLAFDVDLFKMTALHWTARENNPYLTKILLQKYRANPMAKDMYGRTPMHLAVSKKNITCFIRIFVEGGQVNSLDGQGRSVKAVAPDDYTIYLIEKLQETKFLIRSMGIKDTKLFRQELQKHIKFTLAEASLYF